MRRGSARQAIPSSGARRVRIAGRSLAYLEGVRASERAVLYDLERRVGGRGLTAVNVQPDGALALARTNGRAYVSLLRRGAARERGAPPRRVLARVPRPRAIGGFDLAAARVVWSAGLPSGHQRIELQRL